MMVDHYKIARKKMLDEQLIPRGIKDEKVLQVIGSLPRHCFVQEALVSQAYSDYPLNIGEGQTISQPYIVALMTQCLALKGDEKILEIGTGCGYQAAVLAKLCKAVYSIERIKNLSNKARRTLYELGLFNAKLKIGDGTLGWPENAPYDGIVVTAGAPVIPEELVKQLKDGGRLVIPVGDQETQIMKIITRRGSSYVTEDVTPCRFVKLIGKQGWK